jgi:hypothetical protein
MLYKIYYRCNGIEDMMIASEEEWLPCKDRVEVISKELTEKEEDIETHAYYTYPSYRNPFPQGTDLNVLWELYHEKWHRY